MAEEPDTPVLEGPPSFRWKSIALREFSPSSVLLASRVIKGVGSQLWHMFKSHFLMRAEKSCVKTFVIKSIFELAGDLVKRHLVW